MKMVDPAKLPLLRRAAQFTVGGVGTLVLVAGAVVVFGRVGQGGGGSPAAQATVAASPTPAPVVDAKVGNITILDAVIKTTGNDVASLYFIVKNDGPADTLISQATDASSNTSLFNTVDNGGVSTMPLVQSLEIPANSEVKVQPGGYHVMINDIANPLAKGSKVHVTLTFAKAGTVQFDAPVTGY
jgi:copper(I)-binding protein